MKIMTMKGIERDIDPLAIAIVTGPTVKDTNPCACIGIGIHFFKVKEHAADFVASLPNAAHFVKLKFAKGANFWANAVNVASIRPVVTDDLIALPLAQAVITFPHSARFISNDMQTAIHLINAAGGNL
jgi:hypothetical protein